jgi:hypothetical protein
LAKNADADKEFVNETAILRAIHTALAGDVNTARLIVRNVLSKDEKHERATKVLQVIGE